MKANDCSRWQWSALTDKLAIPVLHTVQNRKKSPPSIFVLASVDMRLNRLTARFRATGGREGGQNGYGR